MKNLKAFCMALLLAYAVLLPPLSESEEYYKISETELNSLQEIINRQAETLKEYAQKSQSLENEANYLAERVKQQDESLKEYAKDLQKMTKKRNFWIQATAVSGILGALSALVFTCQKM